MKSGKNNLVGCHIAAARKQAGLSQEELAARLHVTRQTISNYESMRSQPDIQMLVQLADCLQAPVENLIYGEGAVRCSASPAGLSVVCRNLGIAVYLIGILYEIHQGSGVQKVGDSSLAYAFTWGDALPIWAAALIFGTLLLALGTILTQLRLLEEQSKENLKN